MEFQEIYEELLGGKTLRLSFGTEVEFKTFRNALAVYFHRQNSRLKLCGMADEFQDYSLTFKGKFKVVEICFSKKEKKNYNFVILKDDDSSNEAGS